MLTATITTSVVAPPEPPAGSFLYGFRVVEDPPSRRQWEDGDLESAVCTWLERGRRASTLRAIALMVTAEGDVFFACDWSGLSWLGWCAE